MPSPHKTRAPVHYRVEMPDLHTHLYQVTLTVSEPDALQRLTLPAWIPGSYLIREFAKNLQGLQARQGRRALEVLQTGVPLVATEFAVRGFGLRAGSHYLRAENPEEFAHALAAVLRERARFDELAQTGYAHSCALTWERSAERFASWVHTEIHQRRPRSTSSLTVR